MSRLLSKDENRAVFGERPSPPPGNQFVSVFLLCAWLICFLAPLPSTAATVAISIREARRNPGSQPSEIRVRGVITAFS
ncbi:MAG TPA: hypothetical protein VG168_17885, partial [Bryobacteraceae bacterium]|nr:hypothetical protein [Bryobacteraceae bacterium]